MGRQVVAPVRPVVRGARGRVGLPGIRHMHAERKVSIRSGVFRTQVLEGGDGSGLLFLHGSWGLAWDNFLDSLSMSSRVIAPVHPGYGDSSGGERLLDLQDLVVYYLDLLDELGVENVPLVGHSLGAMIGAELAAIQPDRFTKLALIAPLGLWDPTRPVMDFFALEPKDVAPALFHDPEAPSAAAFARVPKEGEEMIAFMLERAKSMATAARYLWPIPDRRLNTRLHRIHAPTLLVWGRSDRVCPPGYSADFQRLIPAAEVAFIDQAGHMPHLEQPERLADVVRAFLCRPSPSTLSPVVRGDQN